HGPVPLMTALARVTVTVLAGTLATASVVSPVPTEWWAERLLPRGRFRGGLGRMPRRLRLGPPP
ncbi:hypothetical protein ACFPYM_17455, partial [Methylobacterium hispanicum]